MPDLRIEIARWSPYPDHDVEHGKTSAYLTIHVGDNCLSRNENLVPKRKDKDLVSDEIYVSLYPLAMWFASCWWRLNYESLPPISSDAQTPSHMWRSNHELVSSGMGFAWPTILFYADGDNVRVCARATGDPGCLSCKYQNGTCGAVPVSRRNFAEAVSSLIKKVIRQLNDNGLANTFLEELWGYISDDLNNPAQLQQRRIEAELGYEPEKCPRNLMKLAIDYRKTIGENSFAEISIASAINGRTRMACMSRLSRESGMTGRPDDILATLELPCDASTTPRKAGCETARQLRRKMGIACDKAGDGELCDLLGLPRSFTHDFRSPPRLRMSVAKIERQDRRQFIMRSRLNSKGSRRHELARFAGDCIYTSRRQGPSWFVVSDASSARQEFQRAFAAEFLCPMESVAGVLDGDYSDAAIRRVAAHFVVGRSTIRKQLADSGRLGPKLSPELPYNPDS